MGNKGMKWKFLRLFPCECEERFSKRDSNLLEGYQKFFSAHGLRKGLNPEIGAAYSYAYTIADVIDIKILQVIGYLLCGGGAFHAFFCSV